MGMEPGEGEKEALLKKGFLLPFPRTPIPSSS